MRIEQAGCAYMPRSHTHKSLSALRQESMIHVRTRFAGWYGPHSGVVPWLHVHLTESSSLASLDVARREAERGLRAGHAAGPRDPAEAELRADPRISRQFSS